MDAFNYQIWRKKQKLKMHEIEHYSNFGPSYHIYYVKVLPETLQFGLLVSTDQAYFFSQDIRDFSWKYSSPILQKVLI